MISFDLKGKTALITGAASGIGYEAARMMGLAGARVAINYLPDDPRGEEALATLRAEGIEVFGAPGDVGDAASVTAMVAKAVADLGGLDLLVNNAGMPGVTQAVPIQDLDSLTEELWDKLLNVNLQSVFRVSKAAAPALKASRGAIVNTASIAGMGAVASTLVYSASKAGVINLTKNLARALAPEVRVNGVAPGTVVSPWGIAWTEERTRSTIENTPLKKLCMPADIAETILYLGFAGAMITGQIVVVDGGIWI